jgi:ABC-type bacteriocin/lantibiotic exporter with double-glycine peptidase domain
MPSYITKSDTSSIHLPQGIAGASKALKRLAQLDPNQYSSEQEYSLWAASACSTAAITEVINAYGHNYRISDILHIEIGQSVISPELGLLKLSGIDRTVTQFGFSTAQLNNAPLDSILSVANNGWPIIVDFPPSRDWSTGHFLVVTGGDSSSIFLADSSSSNITSLSHQRFLQDWGGFAVVVMPKDQ